MAVTDQNGKVVKEYAYSPYGELLLGESDGNIQFLYNGQYGVTTDGNGLYYMRARYYNVDIKRFVNQDVLTGTLERISSLNRYAYVEGNPVSFLDPFGLEPFDTTLLHNVATALGLIGNVISLVALQIGLVFSIIGGSMDILLSSYDLIQHIKQNDKDGIAKDILNIAKNIVGLIFSGVGYVKTDITNDWNMASNFKGIMGGYEAEMEYKLATNNGLFSVSDWINRILTGGSIVDLVKAVF
ncbi:MAG: RHS repeat-associated core domain-containing protein [Lachnospiraceae bacterium]|nr:RHS repeat-associated core domain-containing protein [Lachnospiraceae bacterium]